MWLNWDIFKLEVKMQVLKNKLENLPASKCKQWNYANWACVDTPASHLSSTEPFFQGAKMQRGRRFTEDSEGTRWLREGEKNSDSEADSFCDTGS